MSDIYQFMKKYCSLMIFLAVTMLPASALTESGVANAKSLRNHDIGDKLPAITLANMVNGEQITFTPGNGKPAVMLYFSAASDFQRDRAFEALVHLKTLADEYGEKIAFITIIGDAEGSTETIAMAKEKGLTFAILDDSKRDVYNSYGIFMMPVTIICGKDGGIVAVVPASRDSEEIIKGNMKVALGEMTTEELDKFLNPEVEEGKSDEEKKFSKKFNYAKVMVLRRMFPQAEREFIESIALQPDNADAYMELGFVQLELKKYPEAEKNFTMALEKNETLDEAIAGLGLALYGKGDVENALVELQDAFVVKKPRLDVIIAIAEIYESQGKLKESLEKYKLAVEKLQAMIAHGWTQN